MNLVGKKTQFTDSKNIHRRKGKKTTKRTIYANLPMCQCTKFYTNGTVYSSVLAKAVTSGQEVDNNWAQITMHYLVYSRIS